MSTVMFESWRGRYADSPRAVSELLGDLRPQLTRWWTTTDGLPPTKGVRAMKRHSPAYFRRLLTTDFLITNDIVSRHVVKGPGVTYVQCWHGTPLKAIGHDEVDSKYASAATHLKRVDRDVAKWDFLVSPSPACTTILRKAFQYDGVVLETGYPRNDILARDDGAIRASVRKRLGIAADVTVILYAPTWRDDAKDAQSRFYQPDVPDMEFLRRNLPGSVILVRLHPNVMAPSSSLPGFTIDVGGYPDISELYLAADVLVSDYSSAIYDFAVTGKPIVLYAPDLEHYRTSLRPMYFVYEDWAPGPITHDTRSLAEVLTDLDAAAQANAHRYDRFRSTFCPWDDGNATKRLVNAVFR